MSVGCYLYCSETAGVAKSVAEVGTSVVELEQKVPAGVVWQGFLQWCPHRKKQISCLHTFVFESDHSVSVCSSTPSGSSGSVRRRSHLR